MNGFMSSVELPQDFSYPALYLRAAEEGLHNLDPWWALDEGALLVRYRELAERYPGRRLVPFSRRQDNDDIACWDLDMGGVSVIHDYAETGHEQVCHYENIADWLRAVLEDFMAFDE